MAAAPKSKRGPKVNFSAVNIFAGDNNANKSVTFPAAPDAPPQLKTEPPGITVSLLQNLCTYESFEIDGAHVTGSVVTGMLTRYPNGDWTAVGFEWGALDNGEHYLSAVDEKGVDGATTGTWKLIFGSGVLTGIEGEASYTNHPKPGDKVVRSSLKGWYSLPAKTY